MRNENVRLSQVSAVGNDERPASQAFLFFNLEEIEAFITRCVSEGNRLISLDYAAAYEESPLAHGEKEKGPGPASRGK